MFRDQKVMWSEAQAICMESGAHLMTLESDEKMRFIKGRRTNKPGRSSLIHTALIGDARESIMENAMVNDCYDCQLLE